MILVTGGSGLLGKALLDLLISKGKTVKAIYHTTPLPFPPSPHLITVSCDILDVYALEEVMQDVTEVYHCAGRVSFSPGDEKKLYAVNTEGTANVVNACLVAGIRKLVHVSSVAALGRIRPGEMITEKMNWTPETRSSKYGHSKFMGEMEVWRGVAEGLNAVVVNPSVILGAGDWDSGSSKIFKSVRSGFPWYTEGINGFVDVRDVAVAMIALMENDITAERYIISAENTTYKNVFTEIAKAFGTRAPYKKVTPLIAGLTWRLALVKSLFTRTAPFITRETAATSLAAAEYDNSKLLKLLPDFRYRSLQQTITETCAVLQQNINS